MNHNATFNAPWGTPLKILTAVPTIILIGVSLIGFFSGPQNNLGWISGMIIMPLAILIISSFFIIRGYVLTDNTLLIQRLGWNSKLDLSGLLSAVIDPTATTKSIRTFGNGGMFCFAGLFYNKKLGSFRAFATDSKKSVILRFINHTIVVTPDEPEKFVMKIKELKGL